MGQVPVVAWAVSAGGVSLSTLLALDAHGLRFPSAWNPVTHRRRCQLGKRHYLKSCLPQTIIINTQEMRDCVYSRTCLTVDPCTPIRARVGRISSSLRGRDTAYSIGSSTVSASLRPHSSRGRGELANTPLARAPLVAPYEAQCCSCLSI